MTYTNSPTFIDSADTVVYAEVVAEANVIFVDVLVPGSPGIGLIPGGTTGQFMLKASGTDFDIIWSTLPNAETIGLIAGLSVALGGSC